MPLYRLAPTPPPTPVALVESESSVDALLDAGIAATTWAGGAANPPISQLRRELAHSVVVVVADNDAAGITCLERLALSAHFTRYVLPPPGSDARDLLASVGAERVKIMLSSHLTYPT
jgi:DNA primase